MSVYKVPQDVEAEDKLIGPLTFRKAIYAGVAALGIGAAYMLLRIPPRPFWALLPTPVIVAFLTLAFFPSKDQPVEVILMAKIRFALKPRRRIWDQRGVKQLVTVMAPRHTEQQLTKGFSGDEVSSRLSALARTLDSRGWAVKNVSLNTYSQPVYASGPSDQRLISPSILPQSSTTQHIDVRPADDIMDHANNPIAQHFDQMMTKAAEDQRRTAIDRMHQAANETPSFKIPDQPVTGKAAHAAPHVDLPSRYTNDPQHYATFGATTIGDAAQHSTASTDQPITNEEAELLEQIKAHPQTNARPGAHMKRVKTSKEVAAEEAQKAQAAAEAAAKAEASPLPSNPAILNLANNDDLNIATLARQAEATAGKLGDDEVVISLH